MSEIGPILEVVEGVIFGKATYGSAGLPRMFDDDVRTMKTLCDARKSENVAVHWEDLRTIMREQRSCNRDQDTERRRTKACRRGRRYRYSRYAGLTGQSLVSEKLGQSRAHTSEDEFGAALPPLERRI
jgi:hypothetical protein